MSTVIAFPAVQRRPAGRSSNEKARARDADGPVVVILPVVRIERHETADEEGARDTPMDSQAFGAGPGSRRA